MEVVDNFKYAGVPYHVPVNYFTVSLTISIPPRMRATDAARAANNRLDMPTW